MMHDSEKSLRKFTDLSPANWNHKNPFKSSNTHCCKRHAPWQSYISCHLTSCRLSYWRVWLDNCSPGLGVGVVLSAIMSNVAIHVCRSGLMLPLLLVFWSFCRLQFLSPNHFYTQRKLEVHRLSADNQYWPIIGQFDTVRPSLPIIGIGHLTIGIGWCQ